MRAVAERAGRRLAARQTLRRRALDAGDHAGDHPPHRLRPRRRRADRAGRAPLRRLLDATASQPRLLALQVTSSENPRPRSPWGRFNQLVAAADRVVYEEIHARRDQADGRPRRHPLDAAGGPRRGGPAADRPRAARRADDPAAGRPRDHGDGAELDPGAPGPPPGRGRAAARRAARWGRGQPLSGGDDQGGAAAAPGRHRRRPPPDRAAGDRRPPAAGRGHASTPRSTCSTAAPTSTRSPRPSAPSASSRTRPVPTSGSPSAAASAAASAPASPSTR